MRNLRDRDTVAPEGRPGIIFPGSARNAVPVHHKSHPHCHAGPHVTTALPCGATRVPALGHNQQVFALPGDWFVLCNIALIFGLPMLLAQCGRLGFGLAYPRGYLYLGWTLGQSLGPLGLAGAALLPRLPDPLLSLEYELHQRGPEKGFRWSIAGGLLLLFGQMLLLLPLANWLDFRPLDVRFAPAMDFPLWPVAGIGLCLCTAGILISLFLAGPPLDLLRPLPTQFAEEQELADWRELRWLVSSARSRRRAMLANCSVLRRLILFPLLLAAFVILRAPKSFSVVLFLPLVSALAWYLQRRGSAILQGYLQWMNGLVQEVIRQLDHSHSVNPPAEIGSEPELLRALDRKAAQLATRRRRGAVASGQPYSTGSRPASRRAEIAAMRPLAAATLDARGSVRSLSLQVASLGASALLLGKIGAMLFEAGNAARHAPELVQMPLWGGAALAAGLALALVFIYLRVLWLARPPR